MNLILFGAPGVGKGTVSEMLEKKYSLPHISTGDLFRDEVKKGTSLGRQVQELISEGKLVPDDLVISLIKQRLSEKDCSKGFLLDGFPRTLPQADSLEVFLSSQGKKIDFAVNIWIPREEIVRRLSSRRTCKACGSVYNLQFKDLTPKKEGVCDKCGGELYQREDDKEETILQRLDVYEKQTVPLVEYYRKKGFLVEVTGESSEVIFKKLCKILEVK